MLPLAKVEAVEDEHRGDSVGLPVLELLLDVALEGEGEPAQGDEERFLGGVVVQVQVEVVGGFDAHDGTFQRGQREALRAGGSPFVE